MYNLTLFLKEYYPKKDQEPAERPHLLTIPSIVGLASMPLVPTKMWTQYSADGVHAEGSVLEVLTLQERFSTLTYFTN